MLKILSQQQQEHHGRRGHDIKTNFGPLKHKTEQVYNQNIYYFLFLQVENNNYMTIYKCTIVYV